MLQVSSVNELSASEAEVFPDYIFPNFHSLIADNSLLVRSTYASCISALAECALKFLELSEALFNTAVSSDPLGQYNPYDMRLREIQEFIQNEVLALLTDQSNIVKEALLSQVGNLCVFFGRQKSNDILLSHIITYLNEKNWRVRR